MTMPEPPRGTDWLAVADRVGTTLRTVVREETGPAHEVRTKPGELAGDVVTAADLRAQARLQAALAVLMPGSRFIGEEDFAAVETLDTGFAWIVDPLDGTLNFACGLPFFGASVALVHAGEPVLGVVYDAGADSLFDATGDGPARRDGEPFTWDATRAARAPVAISSGLLGLMRGPDGPRIAPEWLGQRFRILGAQAVQLCWAAEGRLRLNIGQEAKLWDDAAGALICRRAGAGYAALGADPLYPLAAGSPALAGKSLFSVAGSPDLVARYRAETHRQG